MEKKLLWLKDEKDFDGNYYSALIDANQIYNAVYVGEQGIRIWAKVTGDTKVEIPSLIIWEDEEYNSLSDMDSDDMRAYLDFLVGQEGEEISDYEKQDDCLVFDYYNDEFANLTDWETEFKQLSNEKKALMTFINEQEDILKKKFSIERVETIPVRENKVINDHPLFKRYFLRFKGEKYQEEDEVVQVVMDINSRVDVIIDIILTIAFSFLISEILIFVYVKKNNEEYNKSSLHILVNGWVLPIYSTFVSVL